MKIKIISYLALGILPLATACNRSGPTPPGAALPPQTRAAKIPENLFKRMMNGAEAPKITAEQVETYLTQNHRSAASLLGAFRATGDESLLQEAMRIQPGNPQVIFAALIRNGVAPEERRRSLAAFKKSAPENALANYLAALDNFKGGQAVQAIAELQATAKKSIQDYSDDFVKNTSGAYQAAGYSEADAVTAATVALPLPHLAQLKELSGTIGDLAAKYRQSGNLRGAQTIVEMGLELGRRLDTGQGPMVRELVGIAIQRQILGSLDPSAPYGDAGQTVQNRLDALARERDALQTLAHGQENVVSVMTDEDVVGFFQRVTTSGEIAAAKWALNKYATK